MVTATGNFANRPFRLRVESWYNWQSGSSASVHIQLWVDKLSYSPTQSGCCSAWSVYVNGGLSNSWSGGFNFVNGDNFLLTEYDTAATTNINGDVTVSGYADFDIMGHAEAHLFIDGVALSTPPAPTMIGTSMITTTSMRVQFSGNGDGGSPITSWGLQYATDAAFTQNVVLIGSGGTSDIAGLTPGTTYWFRARGQNAIGVGAWSSSINASTLPSVPPGMTITASPAGGAATVLLTPPGGVSGVTQYNVTYTYLSPAPIPTPASVTVSTMTNTIQINGLVPGATYAWSATANIGSYVSPASTPQNLVQPQPFTGAGDYFDGSTPAKTDTTYAWAGAVGNSISTAVGEGVTGWEVTAVSGGTVVLARTTGGYAGSFSARAIVKNDLAAVAPGIRLGLQNADPFRTAIEPDTLYWGSIYVQPSRQNRFSAEITWVTAAGALVTRLAGQSALCPQGVWTRLAVSGTAPATAAFAMVRVIDATGAGWSRLVGGDVIIADAAMISLGELFTYFDGDTADSDQFSYEWTDAPNASQSIRVPLTTYVDLLADPDCPPIPAPPRPPVVPSDCIADVGVWRRYWAYIPSTEVADWLTVIPTLELDTAGTAERQVRVRVYPDPFNRDNTLVNAADFCSEQIISYIPPNTVMTLDGVTERVWAEVNGGASISADHLLYGSNGTPAVWPHLSCGIGYWASFDVPNDSPSGNLSVRVALTQRT